MRSFSGVCCTAILLLCFSTTVDAQRSAASSRLTATAAGGSRVDLSWTRDPADATTYELLRATDRRFTRDVVTIRVNEGSSYANVGLTASTTYFYKVRATGILGKFLDSNVVRIITGPAGSIPSHFYGINAWMPKQIGGNVFNGRLSNFALGAIWTPIVKSGVTIMRYGGRGVDRYASVSHPDTLKQYSDMAVAMKANGIKPMLQVPMFGQYTAAEAATIVRHVNATSILGRLSTTRYWVIGNEPDLTGVAADVGYGGDGSTPTDVATYLKQFATAMKTVDPGIKIIGPETASYNATILDALTCGADDVFGQDGNGNYYLDYLSFHIYPFSGEPEPKAPKGSTAETRAALRTARRAAIIGNLMSPGGFDENLRDLQRRVSVCNTAHFRTQNPVKIAVTEANINYAGDDYKVEDDRYDGVWAKSFLGGQFWAEMMGIALERGVEFLTFWSVVEDDGLSYLSPDGTTPLPSYYHFQMMANHFRGSSVETTDDRTNVKAFGAKDTDQIAVLILNQEEATDYRYTVSLGGGARAGVADLSITVDADMAVDYSGKIGAQSTVMLIFNKRGKLMTTIEYGMETHAQYARAPSERSWILDRLSSGM